MNLDFSAILGAAPTERPRYLHLFTHDDLDGVGCSIIFKARYGLDAPATYCNYSTFNSRIAEYIGNMETKHRTGLLMITDASVTPQTAALIDGYVERGGQVALLDHHSNGAALDGVPYLEWISTKPWAHVDALHCGTKLAYDYLQPGIGWAAFADLVQDYDVSGWLAAYPGHHPSPSPQAKELNQLRYLVGKEDFATRFAADPSVEFNAGERLVLDLDHRTLDNYRKEVENSAMVLEPNELGQRFAVAFCDRYTTDVAHAMMNDLKLDGVVLIDLHHHKLSFRSHEGVNVGRVAQFLGGGGHAQAAGVTMEAEGVKDMIKALDALTLALGTTVSNLTAKLSLPPPSIEAEAEVEEPAL